MAETDTRTFFRDVKPYCVVERLEDLQGPAAGMVRLSHSVRWVGDGWVSLDEPGGVRVAYQAVLAEGTVADQIEVLNPERLMAAWNELSLPGRVRELWETRFPGLRPDRRA